MIQFDKPLELPAAEPSTVQSTVQDFIISFVKETLEILVLYIIYAIVTDNSKFEFKKAVKVAVLLGLFSTCLEYYSPSLKGHVKVGLFSSIGGAVKTI